MLTNRLVYLIVFSICVLCPVYFSSAQEDELQIEELPEDKPLLTSGASPSDESEGCKAREAAINAVKPKQDRPYFDPNFYEKIIREKGLKAGTTEFDQEKYAALESAFVEAERTKGVKRDELIRRYADLKEDLKSARSEYPLPQERIKKIEGTISAILNELGQFMELSPEEEAFNKMAAAKDVLEAKRSLNVLFLWEQFDNTNNAFLAAEKIKDKELDAVKAEFTADQTRFNQEHQALKQQADRSEATLAKARDLKNRTTSSIQALKNRLLKHDCWPDVQTLIVELEKVLFNLNRWKVSTAIASDFEVEEIPDDDFGDDDGKNQPPPGRKCDPAVFALVPGTWQSEWGPVTLGGSCDHITGSWNQSESAVGAIKSGTFDSESRRLVFQYYQNWNNVNGEATFTLAADGKTFDGGYDGGGGNGLWTMKKQ